MFRLLLWLLNENLTVEQIRDELVHHNIRLYPFDTDENDEEEIQLNESIRVCRPISFLTLHWF
jgi:septin family protein